MHIPRRLSAVALLLLVAACKPATPAPPSPPAVQGSAAASAGVTQAWRTCAEQPQNPGCTPTAELDFKYYMAREQIAEFYGCRPALPTLATVNKVDPCINGSLRLQLDNGKLQLFASHPAGQKVDLKLEQPQTSGLADAPVDSITVQQRFGDSLGLTSILRLKFGKRFYAFNTYVKTGDGKWELLTNPDKPLAKAATYEIFVTWLDRSRPMDATTATPLPPGFGWSTVQKYKGNALG